MVAVASIAGLLGVICIQNHYSAVAYGCFFSAFYGKRWLAATLTTLVPVIYEFGAGKKVQMDGKSDISAYIECLSDFKVN